MTFIKLQASQYNIEVRLFIVEGGKTSWNPLEPHPQASLSERVSQQTCNRFFITDIRLISRSHTWICTDFRSCMQLCCPECWVAEFLKFLHALPQCEIAQLKVKDYQCQTPQTPRTYASQDPIQPLWTQSNTL